MRNREQVTNIYKMEEFQEYQKWQKELPYLHFEKEWNVKIIPPFCGAIIRFYIEYNGKYASVYFDGYSELGFLYDDNHAPIPYFEFYDGDDIHRYCLSESEQMMKDIKNHLNITK